LVLGVFLGVFLQNELRVPPEPEEPKKACTTEEGTRVITNMSCFEALEEVAMAFSERGSIDENVVYQGQMNQYSWKNAMFKKWYLRN